MEYLSKIMKKTGWSSLLSSIVFAILGIILIARPEGTIKAISYVLGAMFMIIGVYKIISYFKIKGKYDFLNYDLAFGIIAIIIGIVTIVYIQTIGTIILIYSILDIIESIIFLINIKEITE